MGIITRIFWGKDQDYFNKLKPHEKLAFCRLISEVVREDDAVISAEFDELPEIPKSFMANSKDLTLEQAINDLKTVPSGVKDWLKEELDQITESDQYRSDEEDKLVEYIKEKL